MVVRAARRRLRPIVKPAYERLYQTYSYSRFRVASWSSYENIYHCCTQKTASQWFRRVLCDPTVFRYTGLKPFRYPKLGLREASIEGPLPRRTIGIHLYIDYPTYEAIPKPEKYRTFFILRDPRDIVVSWYFSAKYSHKQVYPIPELRRNLEMLDLREGLKYIIDAWNDFGLFEAQRSWMGVPAGHPNIEIFRYEEFARDNYAFLKVLLDYLDVQIPAKELDALYQA